MSNDEMAEWQDLSDVELRGRLCQRDVPSDVARWLVDRRDEEIPARQISEVLNP